MGVVPVVSTPWTTFGLDFHGGACASCLQPLQLRSPFPGDGNDCIPYTTALLACQLGERSCVARAAIPTQSVLL
jgi:hypothetical protein